MNICIDTNVLVAALIEDHPHYAPASSLLLSLDGKRFQSFISTHTLAELYAVLTRAPFKPPVHPVDARRMIDESILPRVELVSLTANEYRQVVTSCAASGWTGGAVYDAIHIRVAQKAKCDRLYTFNFKQFRAIAGEDFAHAITVP